MGLKNSLSDWFVSGHGFTGCGKMRFGVELAPLSGASVQVLYFCHHERASAREGSAFLTLAAHPFSPAAQLRQRGNLSEQIGHNSAVTPPLASLRICALFTKAENVTIPVFDIKIEACPRSFFKRPDHVRPTHFQFAEQAADPRHGNVRIQMFVPFAMFSFRGQFRRTLQMNRESVPHDRRIERLIPKAELEAQLFAVVRDGCVKIVDEKLRDYSRQLRSALARHCRQFIPHFAEPRYRKPSCTDCLRKQWPLGSILPWHLQ
jgi:hypothetical protein